LTESDVKNSPTQCSVGIYSLIPSSMIVVTPELNVICSEQREDT
jgi:hypothetical protein